MRYITTDELDHMPDPIAQLVWRRWLKEGKAELVEDIRKCDNVVYVEDVYHGGVY
jgi:hypothetical protein